MTNFDLASPSLRPHYLPSVKEDFYPDEARRYSSWYGRMVSSVKDFFSDLRGCTGRISCCYRHQKEKRAYSHQEMHDPSSDPEDSFSAPLLAQSTDEESRPPSKPKPLGILKTSASYRRSISTQTPPLKLPKPILLKFKIYAGENPIKIVMVDYVHLLSKEWVYQYKHFPNPESPYSLFTIQFLGPFKDTYLPLSLHDRRFQLHITEHMNEDQKRLIRKERDVVAVDYLKPIFTKQVSPKRLIQLKDALSKAQFTLIPPTPSSLKIPFKLRHNGHWLLIFYSHHNIEDIAARIPFIIHQDKLIPLHSTTIDEEALYSKVWYQANSETNITLMMTEGASSLPIATSQKGILKADTAPEKVVDDEFVVEEASSLPATKKESIKWGQKVTKVFCDDNIEELTTENLGNPDTDKTLIPKIWSYKEIGGIPYFNIRRLGPDNTLTFHFIFDDPKYKLQIKDAKSPEEAKKNTQLRKAVVEQFLLPVLTEHLSPIQIATHKLLLDKARFTLVLPKDKTSERNQFLVFQSLETSTPFIPKGTPFCIRQDGILEPLSDKPMTLAQFHDVNLRYDIAQDGSFRLVTNTQ